MKKLKQLFQNIIWLSAHDVKKEIAKEAKRQHKTEVVILPTRLRGKDLQLSSDRNRGSRTS